MKRTILIMAALWAASTATTWAIDQSIPTRPRRSVLEIASTSATAVGFSRKRAAVEIPRTKSCALSSRTRPPDCSRPRGHSPWRLREGR